MIIMRSVLILAVGDGIVSMVPRLYHQVVFGVWATVFMFSQKAFFSTVTISGASDTVLSVIIGGIGKVDEVDEDGPMI